MLALVYHVDLDMDLVSAVAAPRIHHQWRPDRLSVEATLAPRVLSNLENYGHTLSTDRNVGVTQAIGLAPDGKTWIGVHDPRVAGKAAARVSRLSRSERRRSGIDCSHLWRVRIGVRRTGETSPEPHEV